MYHFYLLPPSGLVDSREKGRVYIINLPFRVFAFLSVQIFTFLIRYGTGCFAGRLAGCLAFAASALGNALL
jgi:hypothetical protein